MNRFSKLGVIILDNKELSKSLIEELWKQSNLSAKEFAEEIAGIPERTFHRIRSGDAVLKFTTFFQIATKLEVSLDSLQQIYVGIDPAQELLKELEKLSNEVPLNKKRAQELLDELYEYYDHLSSDDQFSIDGFQAFVEGYDTVDYEEFNYLYNAYLEKNKNKHKFTLIQLKLINIQLLKSNDSKVVEKVLGDIIKFSRNEDNKEKLIYSLKIIFNILDLVIIENKIVLSVNYGKLFSDIEKIIKKSKKIDEFGLLYSFAAMYYYQKDEELFKEYRYKAVFVCDLFDLQLLKHNLNVIFDS